MSKYVGILLFDSNNNLLLQKRDNDQNIQNPGKISTFGGAVDESEALDDAIRREIFEELGINITPKYYNMILKQKGNDTVECYYYIYHLDDLEQELIKLKEGKEIFILNPNKLNDIKGLSPTAEKIIRMYFSGTGKLTIQL